MIHSAVLLSARRIRHFALALLLISNALAATAVAQEPAAPWWDAWLESAPYGKPLVSEIHSTLTKIELGFSKEYSEFDLLESTSRFDRPIVEMHLGMDAPLYATTWADAQGRPRWGFAAVLPLSVHVLEDMWGPLTAPVINTDYRFGGPKFMAIRRFDDAASNRFLKNISLTWLPIFHECTHLGDEITIYRKDENLPITRINVSYEYTELQLTLNDPDGARETRHTLRLGGLFRLSDRGLGWFSVREDAELTVPLSIAPSDHRFEWYGAYQLQRTDGWLASSRIVNVVSFEARNRVRYGYPLFKKSDAGWDSIDVKEEMRWTFNLYVGWKFYPRSAGKQSVGLYFHGYRGLNPYGQLRNHPDYPFFGASLVYEP